MKPFRPLFFAMAIVCLTVAAAIAFLPGQLTRHAAATAGAGTLALIAPTGKVTVGDTVQVTAQMQGSAGRSLRPRPKLSTTRRCWNFAASHRLVSSAAQVAR